MTIRTMAATVSAGWIAFLPGGLSLQFRPDGRVPEFAIVDLAGDGICLTSMIDGVRVRFARGRTPVQTAWTCAGRDDAFVVRDMDSTGAIESMEEVAGGLLGPPNGLEYLRALDKGSASGKPDGWLDAGDSSFSSLLLWTDRNHNGVSEEPELQSVAWAGVQRVSLTIAPADRVDGHGNRTTAESTIHTVKGVLRSIVSVLFAR